MMYPAIINTETKMSSGWQPWYSLEMLKTSFNISSEYQGSQTDDLSISVNQMYDGLHVFISMG